VIYIGIDPGVSGGLACLRPIGSSGYTFIAEKMPPTERDLLDLLHSWTRPSGAQMHPCDAMLERVHSMPGQGHSGAFTFGRNVGALKMALIAAHIPFDQVSPQTWQKAMGVIYPKHTTDTVRKNIAKRRAQEVFPTVTVTHAIADALLIAEYCRRLHLGWLYGKKDSRAKGIRETRRREKQIIEIEENVVDSLRRGITGIDLASDKDRTVYAPSEPRRPDLATQSLRSAQPGAPRHGARPKRAAR
jgi:hypothetical protein